MPVSMLPVPRRVSSGVQNVQLNTDTQRILRVGRTLARVLPKPTMRSREAFPDLPVSPSHPLPANTVLPLVSSRCARQLPDYTMNITVKERKASIPGRMSALSLVVERD
jgi:hypothetical protein